MPLLGYDKWENFVKVIEKAKLPQRKQQLIDDHFLDVGKMVVGSGAERKETFVRKEVASQNNYLKSLALQVSVILKI